MVFAQLEQIESALMGWLWIMPVAGAVCLAAWLSSRFDLGNSCSSRFPGYRVHHSIGTEDVSIAINLSDRILLVSAGDKVDVYPFACLNFARPHREGPALQIIGWGGLALEAYPASRMVAELALEGRDNNVFVQLLDLGQHRSAFARFAARQRSFKWLARLHQASTELESSVWGASAFNSQQTLRDPDPL